MSSKYIKMLLTFVTRTQPVLVLKTHFFPALPGPDRAPPRPSSLPEAAMDRDHNFPVEALECL